MNLVHQVLYLSLETWSFLIQAFSWQITCQCSPSIELKRSFVGRDFVRHCMEEPGAAAPLNITTLLLLTRGCRLCLSILWLHHSFILIHFWGRFELSAVSAHYTLGLRCGNLKSGSDESPNIGILSDVQTPVWLKGYCSISVKVVNYIFLWNENETTGHPPLHFVKWIIERLRVNGPLIREERLLSFPPSQAS